MASWAVGGEARPLSRGEAVRPDLIVATGKRKLAHLDEHGFYEEHDHYDEMPLPKKPRSSLLTSETDSGYSPWWSIPEQNLSFVVIREQPPSPNPPTPEYADVDTVPSSMERTASGLSISSDTSIYNSANDDDMRLLDDDAAARLVEDRLQLGRRRAKDSQRERILRSLIQPRSRHAEFSIDNAALESIFSAANEIFFHNCLSQRVTWDWSHASSAQYKDHIIGTTALRRSKMGGFETLIVLSNPILKDKKYNRRLVISTFLHELIHSYLFIKCGIRAQQCGGHTPGFRRIAELVDIWAGPDNLHLQDMEADLDYFRKDDEILAGHDTNYLDASSTAGFHSAPKHFIPHHQPQYDNHLNGRFQYQSHDRWEYCINDHRGYFPVSRGNSPMPTTPTTTEGDFDEVEPLEEGEIREPRGRMYLPDEYTASRCSSAHHERYYDSHSGPWSRYDERRKTVVLHDRCPESVKLPYVRGCRHASPTCV